MSVYTKRTFFDINHLNKAQLITIMRCASRVRKRTVFSEDLTDFDGTTEDAIEMIVESKYNGFHIFKEVANDSIEYQFGCRFWTNYKDFFELNIRTSETNGDALICEFSLKERKPRLRSWWRLGDDE